MTNMTMTRGDTFCVEIEVEGVVESANNLYFVLKQDFDSDEPLIINTLTNEGAQYLGEEDGSTYYEIYIYPEQTEELEPGQYYYEIKLDFDGAINTVLKGILKIEEEVYYVQD